MNKVIVVGNLTRDPEMRYSVEGMPVCSFRLASNKRRGGEDRETLYVNVKTFQRLAETCATYLSVGRKVLVDGRLVYREWEMPDGQKRSLYEIVAQDVTFLDRLDAPDMSDEEMVSAVDKDDIPF